MNILLINHYAGSIQYGMEYRPYYLAQEWVRAGQQVTIAAASFSHVRSRQPALAANYRVENIAGIRYVWLKTPLYHGNGIPRVVNIFSFLRQLNRHRQLFCRPQAPDVIIASSTYPFDVVLAHRLARQWQARLVYEVHDLWPLSLIELGGMSPRHPFIAMVQWAEDYAYRNADLVISMLPKALPHMQAHGLPSNKFAYVPNGINVAEWSTPSEPLPDQHAGALGAIKNKSHFVVGYAGSLGIANALDALIQAARRLASSPVSFVLVGQGPEKNNLEMQSARFGLENIYFLPSIPKLSMPAFFDATDALYIGWQKKALYRFGINPNKLMDYMMSGKPVIHAVTAGNDLVAESDCGLSVPAEDADAIARAILDLKNLDAESRQAMGCRGKTYVLKNLDYCHLANQFIERLANV